MNATQEKQKELIGWGTSMRNPRTELREEYVWVCAPTIDELQSFYDAIHGSKKPFQRHQCQRVTIIKEVDRA